MFTRITRWFSLRGSHTWQSSECPCQVDYPLPPLTLPHSSEHTQFTTPRKQQQWSAASYEPRSDLQDLIALLLVMIAPVLISLSSSLRSHGELNQLLHFHSVQVYSSSSTRCVRFLANMKHQRGIHTISTCNIREYWTLPVKLRKPISQLAIWAYSAVMVPVSQPTLRFLG